MAAGAGGGDPRSGRQPERRAADVPLLHGQGSLREQGPGALLGLYARRRRHKTYERIERAREDERIPLNRKVRETLAWVLANRVMHDEDEL